jgi:hypothetical protein
MLVLLIATFYAAGLLGLVTGQGRLVACMPAIAGASLLLTQAVGQRTWPRPSGVRREAELVTRQARDVAPRRLVTLSIVWASAAVLALATFISIQSGPREVARVLPGGEVTTAAPFPGSYFGVPLLISIVLVLAGAAAVLRMITLRPAVAGVPPEWDMRLRRRSAYHLLRGIQLVLALTLAGVLAVAGAALRQVGDPWVYGDGTTVVSAAHTAAGSALLLTALVIALCGAGVTFLPSPQRRAPDLQAEAAAA